MSTKKLQIVNQLITIDNTLTQIGVAADAGVVGNTIADLQTLIGDSSVAEQITNAYPEITDEKIDEICSATLDEALEDAGLTLTPKKGIDYWTEEDKQQIVTDVLQEMSESSELNFVDSEARDGMDRLSDKIDSYKVINVKSFGAKGDGVTNDAPAIRNAIAATPDENFILYFPVGVYVQGDGTNPHYDADENGNYSGDANIGEPIYFLFENKKNFKISGYGATILAHPNNSCIQNNRGFYFEFCENFIIEGLTYNGNIENRKPWGDDYGKYNAQSGFDIRACKYCTLVDITSIGCSMDGFFLSLQRNSDGDIVPSEHIHMENCVALRNYRQGLSIVGARYGYALNCEFSETGTIYGTSPLAGVDIESSMCSQIGWKFDHCICKNNVGCGLNLSANATGTILDGCVLENNSLRIGVTSYNAGSYTYNNMNCIVRNCSVSFDEGIGSVESYGGGLLFENNFIKNCNLTIDTDMFSSGKTMRNTIRNNQFSWDFDVATESFTTTSSVTGNSYISTFRGVILRAADCNFENNTLINPTGFVVSIPVTKIYNFSNNIILSTKDISEYGTYLGHLTSPLKIQNQENNTVFGQYSFSHDSGDNILNASGKVECKTGIYTLNDTRAFILLVAPCSALKSNVSKYITLEYFHEKIVIDIYNQKIKRIVRTDGSNSSAIKISEPVVADDGNLYFYIIKNNGGGYIDIKAGIESNTNVPNHEIANAFSFTVGTVTDEMQALTYYNPFKSGTYVTALPDENLFTFSNGDMCLYNSTPIWRYNNGWVNALGEAVTSDT